MTYRAAAEAQLPTVSWHVSRDAKRRSASYSLYKGGSSAKYDTTVGVRGGVVKNSWYSQRRKS
jgi:hypothetical protein